MNRTLTTMVSLAALGLGCAKDVPVYSPQPEVIQEVPGQFGLYKSVWSDAEQLKLSLYAQLPDGTRPLDYSWSRFEPKDSAECLKENLNAKVRVDMPEYGLAGWLDVSMEDTACNRSVDLCNGTYTPDTGNQQNVSADVCATQEDTFAGLKDLVNTTAYNIEDQLTRWRLQKGVE